MRLEDFDFLEHKGIDIKVMLWANKVNIKNGKIIYGGSTITQQLARTSCSLFEQELPS